MGGDSAGGCFGGYGGGGCVGGGGNCIGEDAGSSGSGGCGAGGGCGGESGNGGKSCGGGSGLLIGIAVRCFNGETWLVHLRIWRRSS